MRRLTSMSDSCARERWCETRESDETDDSTTRAQESNARRSASLHDGQELLKRIRQKYAADERPYHAFLQALIKFRNKQFSAEEVVQKCAILFYDQPEVLEGEDGLATFVPKTCHPPKRSSWFDWSPAVHHRFGSDNFRLFVRTLLLCEYKSRMNPPEPKMRRWRLTDGDSSESDSDDYSSSEESETESSQQVEKEPGTLRPDQIPSRWVGEEKDRVMSAFERMTLTLEPKDEEYCWADTKAAREAKENKEEIEIRGKRGRTEERDYSSTPRESPSPPPSFNKRRASARIIAKVNRGIVYNRFRSLSSPDGLARGRMRMTRSMSTVSNDLPAKPKNKLILNRDSNKMSPNCAERIGLHSLPADVLQRVIAHYSVQEGKAELNQIRESLIKSLRKNLPPLARQSTRRLF